MAYFGMSKITPLNPTKNLPSSWANDVRPENISDAIVAFMAALPLEARESILEQINGAARPIPAPRAGNVLSAIIRALPARRGQDELTVEELKKDVDAAGVEATPKEIYNAIGYLTRKKHMRRVAYGRYIVDGVEIVTPDDLGGASSRHEDEYRTK